MNKKILGILGLSLLLLTACEDKKPVEKIRPVKIEELGNLRKKNYVLDYPATVKAAQETKLSFMVAGNVEKRLVDAGAFVKKGQVLARLEKKDYQLNLDGMRQKYEAALAMAENASLQFQRVETLYAKKAMAKKEYDMVKSQYLAAQAAMKGHKAAMEHAKKQLADTELRAPYAGYISNIFVDDGSVVGAGKPAFSLSSEGVEEVSIQVPSQDLEKIRRGESFHFHPNTKDAKDYALDLKNVGQAPNLLQMTYPVVFTLESSAAKKDLLAGQSGRVAVKLPTAEAEDLAIPMAALFEEEGSFVYLYKDGIVEKRAVQLGELRKDGRVVILSGLSEGDKLIVAGVSNLFEGEKVSLLPAKSESNVGNVL